MKPDFIPCIILYCLFLLSLRDEATLIKLYRDRNALTSVCRADVVHFDILNDIVNLSLKGE